MSMIPALIINEPWDVARRLSEMTLDQPKLLKIRTIAISAAADATPNHPANAAGTLAYHAGTWGLRNEFVGVGSPWKKERPDGVEAISNDNLKLKVIFANVHKCCDDEQSPKPRSRKGSGAERVCAGNLFGDLPRFVRQPEAGWAIYYLMVDERGAVELSRPILKGGTFAECVERIYLSNGDDLNGILNSIADDDVVGGFDPQVARK